jgi:hypothetical protein
MRRIGLEAESRVGNRQENLDRTNKKLKATVRAPIRGSLPNH